MRVLGGETGGSDSGWGGDDAAAQVFDGEDGGGRRGFDSAADAVRAETRLCKNPTSKWGVIQHVLEPALPVASLL